MKTAVALLVVACAGTAFAGPVNSGSTGSQSLNTNRAVLWNQSTTSGIGTIDQIFPNDFPTYSTGEVDDFSTGGQSWNVNRVTTYYGGGAGAWPTTCTAALSLYAKTGSYPTAADHVGNLGTVSATITNLGGALAVSADTTGLLNGLNGQYWIGLTPMLDFGTYGQQFHLLSAEATIMDGARNRNEGGSFGVGTDWVDGPGLFGGVPNTDHLFTLEGNVVPAPGAAALLALGGVVVGRRRR